MKHARNAAPGMIGVAVNVLSSTGPVGKLIVGGVVAVAAATPFGAWAYVGDRTTPFAPGETVEVGPFEVTIEKVVSTKTLGDVVPMTEGAKLLVVVAEVTNVSDRPEQGYLLDEIVPAPVGAGILAPADQTGASLDAQLDEIPDTIDEMGSGDDATGEPPPGPTPFPDGTPPEDRPGSQRFNVEDAGDVDVINPGITHRVAFVWDQAADADPAEVRVELAELTWIDESFAALSDNYWFATDTITHSGTFAVEPPKGEGK